MKVTEHWADSEFDEAEAKRIYSKYADDERISQGISMLCITEVIRHFQEMRRFLCNLPNKNRILKVKQRLGELIGEEQLAMLDELFPEILQIGSP